VIQTFENREICINCHKKLEQGQKGGIRHKKTEQGYKTGYLCKTCGNYGPARAETQANRRVFFSSTIFSSTEPQPPPKKKERHKQPEKLPQLNRYKPKPGLEINWLSLWYDDKDLKPMFKTFGQMRSFANTYGYGIHTVKDMKNHKAKITKDWLWSDE